MATILLLAIDDSDFSRAATDAVIEHMRHESTTVHVLHVLELDKMLPPAFDFARGTEYGPEITAHVHKSRADAERIVGEAVGRLRDAHFEAQSAVAEGDPRHAILNYAAEKNCDCIVMGSHGRRGLDRLVMGSVSEAVARHAHCSVYIARLPAARATPAST